MSDDEVAVRAVIDRYWPAFLEATMDPDPEHPVLKSVLAGEAELRILGAIGAMKRDGQRGFEPPGSVHSHEITSIVFTQPGRATVRECVVDDLQIIDDATGAILNDAISTAEYVSHLIQLEGDWRISFREVARSVDGVHGCDVLE